MSAGPLIPLARAQAIAETVCAMLRPLCDRIEVAGAIRREATTVRDIDLVCIPKLVSIKPNRLFDPPLQLPPDQTPTLVDRFIHNIHPEADIQLGTGNDLRNGPRWKRFIWQHKTAIDLFLVLPPAQWGCVLAMRTGPSDFSRLLVTHRARGGALPAHLMQKQGALWNKPYRPIETPEESDYFAAIGLPCLPPEQRRYEALLEALEANEAR